MKVRGCRQHTNHAYEVFAVTPDILTHIGMHRPFNGSKYRPNTMHEPQEFEFFAYFAYKGTSWRISGEESSKYGDKNPKSDEDLWVHIHSTIVGHLDADD